MSEQERGTRHEFGAINAVPVVVPVFTPDRRGAGMFSALTRRIGRSVQGMDNTGRFMPAHGIAGTAYHGDSRLTPQRFGGQAALGAGKPYAGTTDLQRETSSLLADGPMKIYAERLKRTSGTGGVSAAVSRASTT